MGRKSAGGRSADHILNDRRSGKYRRRYRSVPREYGLVSRREGIESVRKQRTFVTVHSRRFIVDTIVNVEDIQSKKQEYMKNSSLGCWDVHRFVA